MPHNDNVSKFITNFYRGDTIKIKIKRRNENLANKDIVVTFKRKISDSDLNAYFQKVMTIPLDDESQLGIFRFQLDSSDTELILPGTVYYDIRIVDTEIPATVTTIDSNKIKVYESVSDLLPYEWIRPQPAGPFIVESINTELNGTHWQFGNGIILNNPFTLYSENTNQTDFVINEYPNINDMNVMKYNLSELDPNFPSTDVNWVNLKISKTASSDGSNLVEVISSATIIGIQDDSNIINDNFYTTSNITANANTIQTLEDTFTEWVPLNSNNEIGLGINIVEEVGSNSSCKVVVIGYTHSTFIPGYKYGVSIPFPTITVPDNSLPGVITATITWSEDVTGFELSDILSDATDISFTEVSPSIYEYVFDSEAAPDVTLSIIESAATSTNGQMSIASDALIIEFPVAGTAPIPVLTDDSFIFEVIINIEFDQEVIGFTQDDVTVVENLPGASGPGSVSQFTVNSASSYTLTWAHNDDGSGGSINFVIDTEVCTGVIGGLSNVGSNSINVLVLPGS